VGCRRIGSATSDGPFEPVSKVVKAGHTDPSIPIGRSVASRQRVGRPVRHEFGRAELAVVMIVTRTRLILLERERDTLQVTLLVGEAPILVTSHF
jgi:hypothetical protein